MKIRLNQQGQSNNFSFIFPTRATNVGQMISAYIANTFQMIALFISSLVHIIGRRGFLCLFFDIKIQLHLLVCWCAAYCVLVNFIRNYGQYLLLVFLKFEPHEKITEGSLKFVNGSVLWSKHLRMVE